MRVLLIIDNANMAAQELYNMVMRDSFPGWGVSRMSGLPQSPDAILRGYTLAIYEIGKEDDPRRYKGALALWDEIKDMGTVKMITHIEGPYRDAIVAELEEHGIVCVASPFGPETVQAALESVAPVVKKASARGEEVGKAARDAASRGGLLRGLFRRGG